MNTYIHTYMEGIYNTYSYSGRKFVCGSMLVCWVLFSHISWAREPVLPTDSLQMLLKNPSLSIGQRLQLSLQLTEIYLPLNADSAMWYARQSVELSRNPGAAALRAQCLNRLGETYLQQGHFEEAIRTGKQAYTLAVQAHHTYEQAYATNLIGKSLRKQGRFDQAFQHFLSYLKLSEKLHDTTGIAKALNNLGVICRDRKDYKMAMEYTRKSLVMQEHMTHPPMLVTTLCNVGTIYMWTGNYPLAVQYYTKASTVAHPKKDRLQLSHPYSGLGQVYQRQKNYPLAIQSYNKALQLVRLLKNNGEIVRNATDLSTAYLDHGDLKAAEKLALETLELATQMQSAKEMQILTFVLSNVYARQKNYPKAFLYASQSSAIKDSIYSISSAKIIEDLRYKYNLEKEQLQIKALEKDTIIQQAEIRTKVWQRNISIGAALSAIIFIFLLLRNNGYQKHINFLQKKQTREMEEKNIKLAHTNEVLARINAEFQAQNTAIQTQNQKLEELNTVKTKLFSIISHDIRSPLRMLLGVLSLLEDDSLSKDETHFVTQKLKDHTLHLSDFLDNLLTWARSQMDAITIEPEKLSLHSMITETVELLQPLAEKKSIHIQTAVESDIQVIADRESINIVMRNLISNAVKFTPEAGTVTISTTLSGQHVTVGIQDTGVGISEENQKKLFGQAALSTNGTDDEKGTGLGLLLCKDFVEKNGGRIWVESELKKGSTFKFTLPLAHQYYMQPMHLPETNP